MAVLAITPRTSTPTTLTVNTLSASDTLAYVANAGQLIEFRNTTASIVNVTIGGAGASATYPVAGTGGTTINAAAGKIIAVPGVIGAVVAINLDTMPAYMVGAITVTGGTGLTATILSN